MPLTSSERNYFKPPVGKRPVIVITGDLVEITYVNAEAKKFPGKKGRTIGGFTPSARLRMLRTVARINWDGVGRSLFITLTYPDDCVTARFQDRTRQRYLFRRAMENYLGRKAGMIWRLEWKPRLTGKHVGELLPHVHLIVFNVMFLPWQIVRSSWASAVGAGTTIATDVHRISGARSVAKYVCKYCAKLPDRSLDYEPKVNIATGRHWGICRSELIPWAERKVYYNPPAEFIRLMENGAGAVLPYFNRNAEIGFSLFGEVGRKIGQEMLARGIDDAARVWYNH